MKLQLTIFSNLHDQLPPIEAHDVLVKSGGMSQILLWTSFLEIFGGIALFQTIQGKRYPGDFQFDPLGLSQVNLLVGEFTCTRHFLSSAVLLVRTSAAVVGIISFHS